MLFEKLKQKQTGLKAIICLTSCIVYVLGKISVISVYTHGSYIHLFTIHESTFDFKFGIMCTTETA